MSEPPDKPVDTPSSPGEKAIAELKAGMRRARRILDRTRQSLEEPAGPAPGDEPPPKP